MLQAKRYIHDIPCIIWGKPSRKVYIHIHGKLSCKEHAEAFAAIAEAKGYQTLSFDLPEHGERRNGAARCDIWNGMRDLKRIRDYAFANWESVSVYACSLGAYFCLQTYASERIEKCLFQSPIVDMQHLVGKMMDWFHISPEELARRKEIDTPIDPLRWDYYCFIKEHPVNEWNIPTAILYGEKDDLQSADAMKAFAEKYNCGLLIAENRDHAFMQPEAEVVVERWLRENI